MLLKTIIKKIESKYPLNLAYDWDNVGLLVGDVHFFKYKWMMSYY